MHEWLLNSAIIRLFVSNALPSEDTVKAIRQRADTTSGVLEKILHRTIPPPRYGINE